MKKLFLAICFTFLATTPFANARVMETLDTANLPKPQQPASNSSPSQIHHMTQEQFEDFIGDRLSRTFAEDRDKIATKSTYVEPSEQARAIMQNRNKSEFEKIYDQAMQRIRNNETSTDRLRSDVELQQQPTQPLSAPNYNPQENWTRPDFQVVNITLPPDGRQTVVPAMEHIPYLRSDINILPNGLVKFEDTVVVLADGHKLKNGLTKVLPKRAFFRSQKSNKINYTLVKVMVDGQEVPYKITERDNSYYLVPKEAYSLQPGVYTYTFEYLADRLFYEHDNFLEFYWDVTGSAWNLVTTRAVATISFPPEGQPFEVETLAGKKDSFRKDFIQLFKIGSHTWGVISFAPLLSGEGLHILMTTSPSTILPKTPTEKLFSYFDKHADVVISFLALVVLWLSFKISWIYIKKNKGQLQIKLNKNAALLRYLLLNKFDLTSIGCFLLEFYRKNIIDIQQSGDTVLLIKKTDNLKVLEKLEQKALNQIFTNNDAVFNAGKPNFLKIKRASRFLQKEVTQRLRSYILKMNSGYLFFSLAILLLAEYFMAFLNVDTLRVWKYLASTSVIIFIGIWLGAAQRKYIWLSILLKIFSAILIASAFLVMSAFIAPLSALFIFLSLIIIYRFTSFYAQKNGLLLRQIKEAEKIKENMEKLSETPLSERDIVAHQPVILAFDLSDKFLSESEYNKLSAITKLVKGLS